MTKRKYSPDFCAAIGVSAAWIALAFPWLKSGRSWSNWQDNTNFLGPMMSMISRLWRQGGAPLFTSEVVGGYPLYANPHFNVRYPLYFLWTSWYATPQAASLTLHRLALLHFWILSLTTYLLGRTLSLRVSLAAVVSLGFAFSLAAEQSSVGYVDITAATSWMPAVLAGTVLICKGKLRVGVLITALAASLQICAMPAQVFLMTLLAAAALASSWLLLQAIQGGFRPIRKKLLAVALACGGIIALAGPYMAAVASFNFRSIRWIGALPPIVGAAQRIPKAALAEFGLRLRDLSNVFVLQHPAFVVGHVFVGPMVCFYAAIALYWGVKARRAVPVCLGLLASAFLAFTLKGFAVRLGYHLPLENKVREISWYGLIATLALILLAGIGASELLQRRPWGRREARLVAFGALVFLAATAYAVHRLGPSARRETLIFCMASVACLWAALWAGRRGRSPHAEPAPAAKLSSIAVAASLGLALFPWALSPAPLLAENEVNLPGAVQARRTMDTLVRIAPDIRDYRTDLPVEEHMNWSMLALFYGVRTFQGYVTPQIWKTFDLLYFIRDHPQAARIAGQRYRIIPRGAEPPGNFWKPLQTVGKWEIEEDPEAFPPLFFAKRMRGIFDPANPATYWGQVDAAKRKTGDVFLPRGLVADRNLLAAGPRPPLFAIKSRSEQRVSVLVDAPERRLLVFNEFKAPEWRAEVNGKPATLWTINLTQCGVVTPPGHSQVDFIYEPTIAGWAASRWSWFGWGLFAGLCLFLCTAPGRRLDRE